LLDQIFATPRFTS